ncbi:hypothetical protein, partial [Vibrio parahaemolyticus]
QLLPKAFYNATLYGPDNLAMMVLLRHSSIYPKLIVREPFNAALRGEQRQPPNLNHCAVYTKAESN